MLARALIDPRGIVAGGLSGGAAWAFGVRPLPAAVLGALVAGVESVAASALTRPGRVSLDQEASPGAAAPAAAATPAGAAPAPPAGTGAVRAEACVFRPEGELWRVGMGPGAYLLRDAKGLRYLHLLLSDPGREFHVLQLVAAADGSPAAIPWADVGPEAGTGRGGQGEPRLDNRAKAAYRERLGELRREAEEARAWHDDERAVRAESEIEALAAELARAVGLGGRDRRTGAEAERARVNVTRAIRTAIDRIAEQDRSMGHHLSSTVRTGTFCSYTPDPFRPPSWDL